MFLSLRDQAGQVSRGEEYCVGVCRFFVYLLGMAQGAGARYSRLNFLAPMGVGSGTSAPDGTGGGA
jgi:hypothetical protein